MYACQCQFHYLTTFPKTNTQQLPTYCAMTSKKHPTTTLCHLQAQAAYLYSCHFQHLSPQHKIIQPTKKKTPTTTVYFDFPPFLDVPFWHLLVLPLLQAPFPPRATASPPPRGPQQWLELTRFRRPAEASWLQASLGSRSSRGKYVFWLWKVKVYQCIMNLLNRNRKYLHIYIYSMHNIILTI